MKTLISHHPYLFAEFELDPLRHVLLRDGQSVALNPKTLRVLLVLVERRAEVVSKDELLSTVWPDQIVEENNLTVHISALRKALGEKKGPHQFIVTIPGHGYRFVADVGRAGSGNGSAIKRYADRKFEEDDSGGAMSATIRTLTEPQETSTLDSETTRALLPTVMKSRAGKFVAATVVTAVLATASVAVFVSRQFESRNSAGQFERFDVERQTNTGTVLAATVSPSGQYIAFAQTETIGQSLWLRHIPTGSMTRIVEPKPVALWGLTFTPDDHYIYATTFEQSQADPVLSKVPILGGATERLPVVTNAGVSFSPDGRRIAYVVSSSSSGGSVLWTANADGSDKKFVALRKDPNSFSMQGNTVAWLPDGSTIACAVMNNTDDGLHMSVAGYDVQTGEEKQLTGGRWNVINGVASVPGGGLMLTGNARQSLPFQVWFVSTDGHAQRITNDLNSYLGASTTSDGGTLVTVQTDTTSAIWTGRMSADGTATDLKQVFTEVGQITAIGWRAGGELVYLSVASGEPELWLLETVGRRAKQLTFNSSVSDFAVPADGRYIVLVSNRAGQPNLWRMDADGDGLKQLTWGDGEIRPRFASDSQFVFFQQGFGDVRSSVWKISIDGGRLRQLTSPHQIEPDVSRDGKQIVYSFMDTSSTGTGQWRLGIAEAEGGKQLESFALPTSVTNRVTRWTPDGRGLIFINTAGGVSNLWRITTSGGNAHQITQFQSQQLEAFDLSPDGHKLAVVRYHKTSDVVLLSNRR